MNKEILLENGTYTLIQNYKDAFVQADFQERWTDYFYPYDYIVGDYAYDKLRLKGFCEPENKKCNAINHKDLMEKYIQDDCAYACRYFVLKKISDI